MRADARLLGNADRSAKHTSRSYNVRKDHSVNEKNTASGGAWYRAPCFDLGKVQV